VSTVARSNRSDIKRITRKSRIIRLRHRWVHRSIKVVVRVINWNLPHTRTSCASTYVYRSFDPTDARVYDVRLYLWWHGVDDHALTQANVLACTILPEEGCWTLRSLGIHRFWNFQIIKFPDLSLDLWRQTLRLLNLVLNLRSI